MCTAIGTLWQSQRPGRHETKQKYSSVRKVRSHHTNLHNASAKSVSSTLVWRSDKGCFITTTALSDREWHVQFMSGLHSQIGNRRSMTQLFQLSRWLPSKRFLKENG
jgi:hypothetical protein